MKASHRDRIVAGLEWARSEGKELTAPGPPEDPEVMRESYGETLDDATLAFVVDPDRFVPDSMNVYFQPVHYSEVGDTPVTYVRNRRDRPVPLSLQDEMIGRLPNPEVLTLDGGHIPAITQPSALASILAGLTAP
jgi:pimeloyl-ACP methyl ester carboxylesterase